MTKQMDLGGAFTLPDASMTLNRMGYGAMQLAGPGCGDRHVIWMPRSPCCGGRLPPA